MLLVIVPIVAGATPTVAIIVVAGTMPMTEVVLLPIAGILIDGTYAVQNAAKALSRPARNASAGMQMAAANTSAEGR